MRYLSDALTAYPDPSSWMDVFTIIVVSLIVAVPSWLSVRNHQALKKVDKSISNGHVNPLREDVDEIRNTLAHIREDLRLLKSEFGDMRHEFREERRERIDLDDRFERYRKDH
jgi:DNA gyrase/topoisomerase IV subunit A